MHKIKSWRLPTVAFVVGFTLMVFELAAARMLAPTLGSATYVWTSVIGGIIASLSLGVWIGGRYADLRKKETDIASLLLACALAIGLMLLSAQITLEALIEVKLDQRLTGIITALILFAPTSFLIGACGPYLAKFNVKSLSSTGKSIANLDAMNALGGIAGTFLTGFFLFSLMGTRSIFALLIILLVITSWSIKPRVAVNKRAAASAALVVLALVAGKAPTSSVSFQVNTATASYEVINHWSDGRQSRLLATGPRASQSGIYVEHPDELVFWYTKEISANVQLLAPANPSILVLGGGALTLSEHLAKLYPDGLVDTVEIDPELTNVAQHYFDFDEQPNLRVINQDARSFLQTNKATYDIIIVDVYSDVSVPFALATQEYGASLYSSVKESGIVIVNAIGNGMSACNQLLDATLAPYSTNFKNSLIKKRPATDSFSPSNHVAIFSRDALNLNGYVGYKPNHSLVLTDDYAPLEPIQYSCNYQ